jgi:hypothetical protein
MAGQRLSTKAAKASVATRAHTVEVRAAGAPLGRKLKVAVSTQPPLSRVLQRPTAPWCARAMGGGAAERLHATGPVGEWSPCAGQAAHCGHRCWAPQVVGGGPAGACAAETLAKGGIETYLIERKMDNCKPCGGAIPLCMVEEFDLPEEIIDRKVRTNP